MKSNVRGMAIAVALGLAGGAWLSLTVGGVDSDVAPTAVVASQSTQAAFYPTPASMGQLLGRGSR